MKVEKLIKDNIKNLKPYKPYNYEYIYKMDANESPYNMSKTILEEILIEMKELEFNTYPDTDSIDLRKSISKYIKIDHKQILVGNGSDEMITLLLNTFIGEDDIVYSHDPTFSMYKINTDILGGKYREIETDENFDVNIDKLINDADKAKVIFLCNPNNPTGNTVKIEDIVKLIKNTEGIVIVDEAYIEFGGNSIIDKVNEYDNLIILRTLSKAFGAAGIRVGYLAASQRLTSVIEAVKPPYNLNSISQICAKKLLDNIDISLSKLDLIISERERVYKEMNKIKNIKSYTSSANFILFKVADNNLIFNKLLEDKIMIRYFKYGKLENHLRVSIGTKEANNKFLDILRRELNESS